MPRPRQFTLFRQYVESLTVADRETVTKGINILDRTPSKQGACVSASSRRDAEQFVVRYLDAQNQLFETSAAVTGTLTQTATYPREIVKTALQLSSASVILAHNHPRASPSRVGPMSI